MVDKQTQKSTPPRILFAVLALLFSVFFSGLINTTLANQSVNAINGCPGQEMPGTGANQGKCVGPDGNPTANVPEGAQTPETPGGTISNADTTDNTDEVTCAVEKIGWIVCPVLEQSARIGDQAFGFLAKNFLETEPELISSTEGVGTRVAWDMARNLANIMFIIAFLVIIYSQVTGAGITNYGIKKMLPKLIFAAIAVNVSYYICQIMVDLTNIMGYEIQQFLTDAAKAVTQNTAMPVSTGQSFQSGGTLTTIAVAVLAAGAIVYFLGPVLGAVIGLILMTCLSIIVILLLRKAFIVLLIVISPIAFVLYLLPNTEKYFQKWLSMFWKILLVFPVIGLLMGAGQLASSVILAAGVSSNSYSDSGTKCVTLPTHSDPSQQTQAQQTGPSAAVGECSPGAVPFLLGLTAAGIAVLPLIAVYSVLQGALSAAGAIGGKIGGTVSGWNNGRKSSLQKRRQELGEYRKNRRDTAAMTGTPMGNIMNAASLGGMRRGARRRARYGAAKDDVNGAQEAYNRAARQGRDGTPDEAAEMLNTRRQVMEQKLNAENISAQHLTVDTMDAGDNDIAGGVAGTEARELIANGQFDSPRLAALLEHLNDSNHTAFMAIASGLNGRNLATQTAAKAMGSSGLYGGGDIARMQQGAGVEGGLGAAAVRNASSGGLTAAKIVSASNNSMAALNNAVQTHRASGDQARIDAANSAARNAQVAIDNMSEQLQDSLAQGKRNTVADMNRPPTP